MRTVSWGGTTRHRSIVGRENERSAAQGGTGVAARLPTFLLVGAPKAGSTSLAAHLSAHPQVFVAPEKEVHFFDHHWERGRDWYRSRFAGAAVPGIAAVGEASPTYLGHPDAHHRIAETLPDARLVAILRHPVDRAYSTYWWRHAFESRSFEQAAREQMSTGKMVGYIGESRYVHHLRRLAERFPRERIHVLLLDDLRRDPNPTFAAICRFLGVDDTVQPTDLGAVHNPAFRFRSKRVLNGMLRMRAWRRAPRLAAAVDRLNRAPLQYEPLDAGLRAELCAWFEPDNAALAEWLGRELPASWSR